MIDLEDNKKGDERNGTDRDLRIIIILSVTKINAAFIKRCWAYHAARARRSGEVSKLKVFIPPVERVPIR